MAPLRHPYIAPIIVAFLLLPVPAPAQKWRNAATIPSKPGIVFQWRNLGNRGAGTPNFIEWSITNRTDSLTSFAYFVRSNRGEQRASRISLRPREVNLAGWSFASEAIERVELARLASRRGSP